MSGRRSSKSGFTLTEVLVATMLLTMVMTAVYTMFFSVISTWHSEENDDGLHRKARNALDVMAQEYANLHGGGSQLFEGEDDEFTMFVLTQPMDVESGEGRHLMQVRYRYDRTNQTLEREEALVEGALPPVVGKADEFDRGRIELHDEATFVVARGVAGFTVRYLWVERPEPAYWNAKPEPVTPKVASRHRIGLGLPQAVEIELTLHGGRDSGDGLTVTRRLATRTFARQRDGWELSRLLEELQ